MQLPFAMHLPLNKKYLNFLGKSHVNDDMANLPLVIKEKDVKYQVHNANRNITRNYLKKIVLSHSVFFLITVFANCDFSSIAPRLSFYPSNSLERSPDRHIAPLPKTHMGITARHRT